MENEGITNPHLKYIAYKQKRIIKLISFTLIQSRGMEMQKMVPRVDMKFSFTDTRNSLSKFVFEFPSLLHFYDVPFIAYTETGKTRI